MALTPVYLFHPAPMWAPLALGLMAAQLEQNAPEHQVIYPFAASWPELEAQIATHGPGLLLCSNYMWTREANLEASAQAKAHFPDMQIVHGGPDTPNYDHSCQQFLAKQPAIDYVVFGEGEQTILELAQHLAHTSSPPTDVPGLAFLNQGQFIKTAARQRSQDPNQFPSPFLSGVFDKLKWQDWNAVSLETSRGCPYGCTFCDWGSATLQKMRKFDLERLRGEVQWMAERKLGKLWIADSNFGIFERDRDIARMICDIKTEYGYPRQIITNYAKNTKDHLVDIIEMLVEHGLVSTGIVSMQTRDPATLKAIRRSNIRNSEYDKLRATFEAKKLPLSTQLMIGLPGSTRESFKADLRFFFHQNIDVQLFRTVVLPNSPMADPKYVEEYGLVYAENGMMCATAHLPEQELNYIEQLGRLFRSAHSYGMLRYWLCYLDWDHGIDPVDYLDQLLESASHSQNPWLQLLIDRESPSHDMISCHPGLREKLRAEGAHLELMQLLAEHTRTTYPQTQSDPALETVLKVQAAVMPNAHQAYPLELRLPYDFVSYYQQHREPTQQHRPLRDYPQGQLQVDDPINISGESLYEHMKNRQRPMMVWELSSVLSPQGAEATLYVEQVLAERKQQLSRRSA